MVSRRHREQQKSACNRNLIPDPDCEWNSVQKSRETIDEATHMEYSSHLSIQPISDQRDREPPRGEKRLRIHRSLIRTALLSRIAPPALHALIASQLGHMSLSGAACTFAALQLQFGGCFRRCFCTPLCHFGKKLGWRGRPFTSPSSAGAAPLSALLRVITPCANPDQETESIDEDKPLFLCVMILPQHEPHPRTTHEIF